MVMLTCIEKVRTEDGNILYYTMADNAGNKRNVTKAMIVNAIKDGSIEVTNLKIGRDGRLYDTTKKCRKYTQTGCREEQRIKIESIGEIVNDTFRISEAGLEIILNKVGRAENLEIHTNTNVVAERSKIKKSRIDDIRILKFENGVFLIRVQNTNILCTQCSHVKLDNIKNAEELFAGRKINNIDTRLIKGTKFIYMDKMFKQSKINQSVVNALDTRAVVSMENMFEGYRPYNNEELHISGEAWNTSKLKYMNEMFCGCAIKLISIYGLNLTEVLEMKGTFAKCKAAIDVRYVNTFKLVDTSRMFEQYEYEKLNINWLNTKKVTNMQQMFFCCKTREILLQNIDTDNVRNFRCTLASSVTDRIGIHRIGVRGTDYTMMLRNAVSKLVNIEMFRIAEDTLLDDIMTQSTFDKLIIDNLIISNEVDSLLLYKVFLRGRIKELIIKRVVAEDKKIILLKEVLLDRIKLLQIGA